MKFTAQFSLRLSPDEFKTIQEMAALSGKSMNAFIIGRCLESPAKQVKQAIPGKMHDKPEGAKEPQTIANKLEQAQAWSGGYGKAISSK